LWKPRKVKSDLTLQPDDIDGLLADMAGFGIQLRLEGDALRYTAAPGALTPDLAAKAKALGALCVAEKPFEMDDLSQFLDSLAG